MEEGVLYTMTSSTHILTLLKCKKLANKEERETLEHILNLELQILEKDTRAIHESVFKKTEGKVVPIGGSHAS